MNQPLFHLRQLVAVNLPDGTSPLGHIRSYEPGENLEPRYGGPIHGTAYTVELEGHDTLSRRLVLVSEDKLEALGA